MNEDRSIYELEDLVVQPGTYFNPQTEVVLIVDDSASIDQEIFNMESFEGAEWVRIAELLESFQIHYHPGSSGSVSATALEQGDEELDEGETGQEPGRED